MNNKNLLIGFCAFMTCLWLAVVATYAAQSGKGEGTKARPLDEGTSCSSSSGGAE